MNFNELFGSVPDGWRSCTLGELVKEFGGGIQTGPFGSQLHAADYVENGIPSIMPKNIRIDGVDDSDIARVSPEDIERLSKYKVQTGDIVYSRRGDVEKCSLITELEDGWLCGTGCLRVRLQSKQISPEFLHAYLCHPYVREWIVRHAVGATMPNLNTSILSALPVLVPTSGAMNSITSNWSALSQKLVVNVKINHTLEEMAQAIFKSWFVDFDPVKAMMNGEQPEGMDAVTASLFPEKLVESELGLIPEGWELTNIGKVSECSDKKRIPLSKRQREQKQGSIPYYGATSVMDYVDEAIFDDIYLLIGEDGSVMKDDGTPFIQYIWGPAWVNNHAHVLQGIKSISTEQLMLFFQQTNINAYVTGAVQLKINQRNMNSIPFIKAPKEINERFYDVVAPLYAKIRAIKEENEQLAKLRDTLLPKLLSGEIELG
ncbi:restriction endonuclease subunit S [Vibrio sp. 1S139]|uniref:restriction endonuclease subunit S n=1 Tax=Vibrio sp. 1S139 TaxID=3230006 RepID=UPI00352CC60E